MYGAFLGKVSSSSAVCSCTARIKYILYRCKTFIHYIPVNKGRFKSQALCDEAALAACMAYVDLNPVRAKMADTPETSDHTSIKQRIRAAKNNQPPKNLAQFVGNPREPMPQGLPFTLKDYIELVDWTGSS